jgi:hypothetical protein
MNPINQLISSTSFVYCNFEDIEIQYQFRNKVLELDIPGLVDIQFKIDKNTIRVVPVFATKQDYMWYQLKYNDNPL